MDRSGLLSNFLRLIKPKLLAHDLCWQRLMKHFDQIPSYDKLMDALQHSTVTGYTACMFTRYGSPPVIMDGSLSIQGIGYYDPPANKRPNWKGYRRILKISKARKAFPKSRRLKVSVVNDTASNFDPFLLLPPELRFEIAKYLSTVDFLELRLSSKAMTPLFESRQFWRTRFDLYGERGSLEFVTEKKNEDYRLMYRCTSRGAQYNRHCLTSNLRMQWGDHGMIRDLYMITGAPGLVPSDEHIRPHDLCWTKTLPSQRKSRCHDLPTRRCDLSYIFTSTEDICDQCYNPRHIRLSHTISLPHRVQKIAVSVLAEHESTWITGLDFIHGSDEQEMPFGYRIPGKRTIVDLRGGALTGLDVCVGTYGILAIQAITTKSDNISYNWVGEQYTHSMIEYGVVQLDTKSYVTAFSGDFEVSNMLNC